MRTREWQTYRVCGRTELKTAILPTNYAGALTKPCVGTYLEWWLRRGKDELAYHVSGSPLSGTNVSKSIARDGSLVPLRIGEVDKIMDLQEILSDF